MDDLANQCASLNHLANVAVREHQVEEAAQVAVRAFDTVWKYHVLVPFLQIGLVDAAEAALFALEQGATSVPRSKLLSIVRLGTFKARVLSRLYPYLKGPCAAGDGPRPAADARARPPPSRSSSRRIELLEKGPTSGRLGVAYFDAAVALPHRRAQLLARAREIFTAIGAKAELRRVERLEADQCSPASSARGSSPPPPQLRRCGCSPSVAICWASQSSSGSMPAMYRGSCSAPGCGC